VNTASNGHRKQTRFKLIHCLLQWSRPFYAHDPWPLPWWQARSPPYWGVKTVQTGFTTGGFLFGLIVIEWNQNTLVQLSNWCDQEHTERLNFSATWTGNYLLTAHNMNKKHTFINEQLDELPILIIVFINWRYSTTLTAWSVSGPNVSSALCHHNAVNGHVTRVSVMSVTGHCLWACSWAHQHRQPVGGRLWGSCSFIWGFSELHFQHFLGHIWHWWKFPHVGFVLNSDRWWWRSHQLYRHVQIWIILINTRLFVSLTITFHMYSHDSTRHRDIIKYTKALHEHCNCKWINK